MTSTNVRIAAAPAFAAGDTAAAGAIRASMTVPACPEQVRKVREFVGEALGGGRDAGIAQLLVSELATNSIVHGPAGADVTITITVIVVPDGAVRIEVADAGGESVPVLRDGAEWAEDEGGRGLCLIRDLSARWGYRRVNGGGLVTWFERSAEQPQPHRRAP
jgi:anti-sigma regulatory factor (Ser/Thr protein kinase)